MFIKNRLRESSGIGIRTIPVATINARAFDHDQPFAPMGDLCPCCGIDNPNRLAIDTGSRAGQISLSTYFWIDIGGIVEMATCRRHQRGLGQAVGVEDAVKA